MSTTAKSPPNPPLQDILTLTPLRAEWDPATKSVKDDKGLMAKVSKLGEMKKAMPFVQGMKKRLQTEESSKVLERKLAFDEQALLLDMVPGIKRSGGFKEVAVVEVREGSKTAAELTSGGKEVNLAVPQAENAVPGYVRPWRFSASRLLTPISTQQGTHIRVREHSGLAGASRAAVVLLSRRQRPCPLALKTQGRQVSRRKQSGNENMIEIRTETEPAVTSECWRGSSQLNASSEGASHHVTLPRQSSRNAPVKLISLL